MAKKKPNEEFIEEALERFKLAEEAEKDIRAEGLLDQRMRAGDQWDSDIKKARIADNRPVLTVNRLPQFVRQVANDQRQNRPSIMVSPVDDKADPETAEVLQGLIRHIEYDSNADSAYDTAFECAATGGLGYFRVITEYSDPLSFDLDIKIKRIRNPWSVYIDPEAKEPDRSDMRWAFIVDDFSKEEFEARYPDAEVCKGGRSAWELAYQSAPSWMAGESVRVAEYFSLTTKKATLCMLADGQVLLEEQLAKLPPEAAPLIMKQRNTEIPAVRWCKMIGTEILEDTTWPGRWIPVVPVLGAELEVDGKVILEGVIRHARDSQKMLNVWVSAETEAIGLAPKAPFIVAEGQLEGREKEWRNANTKNYAYLTYKPVSLNGQPVAPPQRNFGEPNVGAITQARLQTQDDLKALTGIYDSALGARSNETTGVAIRARQNQSGTANFHLVDNLSRALRHLGRILIDLIPRVYDAPRVARIIGEDGAEKTVTLNQPFKDEKTGDLRVFDLSAGKYDVRVTAGPSYATKRQEAAASMMQMAQADPTFVQKVGDLLAANMDWPGAEKIAKRLKMFMPPEVQGEETADGKAAQIPPQAAAQMQQMGQMVEQLTAALNQAQAQVAQAEQQVADAQAQVKSKEAELMLKAGELQMKGELEAGKLQLDQQKLALEEQKLALEGEKMRLEELRIMADAVKARMQPAAPAPEAEPEEPEAPEAPPMTREDLVLMFQALLASQPAAPQPPPMPPQTVVLKRTQDGGLIGQVVETPNHGEVL